MDLVTFLVSINKISLLAFFAVFAILVYEVYLIKKNLNKNEPPSIPQFNAQDTVKNVEAKTLITPDKPIKATKNNKITFIILTFLTLVFGTLAVLGFWQTGEPKSQVNPNTKIPNSASLTSVGIKILRPDFTPLTNANIQSLQSGDTIIIGLETIAGVDIDRARIRVNKNSWDISDITSNFDKKNNVFYSQYMIATGQSQLKIEAQLHSKTDGWLGN